MSAVATLGTDRWRATRPTAGALWLFALVISLAWTLVPRGTLPAWATTFPRAWQWGLARELSAWMRWLVNDASLGFVTVKELTRGFAGLLDWPLWVATSLLATGFMDGQGSTAAQVLPPLPWLAVVALAALAGAFAGGWRLALLAGGCFAYLVAFGQWASAMTTLAAIAVAVPLGALGGLLLGIASFRHPALERGAEPAARPDADRADLRLSRAGAVLLRLRPGGRPDRHHRLRHAADGPGHRPGPARRARGDCRVWAHGGLHRRPADLAGAGAQRPADADGGRQPGDHALAQHGDHRLDDRCGRPRLRRAHRPASARHRRRPGGRDRHRRPGDRPRPGEPGAGRTRPRRARRDRPPPRRRRHAARRRRAGGLDLARPGALAGRVDALDRLLLGVRRELAQRPLFRQPRGLQERGPARPDAAAQAVPPGPALAVGDPAGRARRAAAGWHPARGSLHRPAAVHPGHRPVGERDPHRLPDRGLGADRLPDRHAAGHRQPPPGRACGGWCRP